MLLKNPPIRRAETRVRFGTGDSNFGPAKLDTLLPIALYICRISSKEAVLFAGAMARRWTPITP